MKKRVSILGVTGSIGRNSIDVISRDKDHFETVLLSAHSDKKCLEEISRQWPCALRVLSGEEGGRDKLLKAIKTVHADITINGIAGGAGLEPSLAAVESGSALALANKETMVMAGRMVLRLANEKNVKIIPVDSEHSAIFQLIEAHCGRRGANSIELTDEIDEVILTASGGPFRNASLQEMERARPQDALAHPTWKMGKKISVDSASMANKGLEIIEAAAFFNLPPDKIKVVIHPQSVVHSMVRLRNGVIYAQLSKPDMRHPIHDALYWPEIKPCDCTEVLNFDSLTLEFEKPDAERFPMLNLAWEAVRRGGLCPCAYNAANEEAVTAFLNGKIGFLDIPRITDHVLSGNFACGADGLESILKADADARRKAGEYIERIKGRLYADN
jgi:1-deoxy-D-xylulose-5-phosphate reductoisomerase